MANFKVMNAETVQSLVRQLLREIGEDPNREGLLKTPERIARALDFLTAGYRQDAEQNSSTAPALPPIRRT